MSEISSPRPLPATPPAVRPAVSAADLAVRLLQPLDGLLAAGESAKAEVIALKEQAQSFQLLLKLTLAGGRQATLQAESPRPLAQGSALLVTALSDTRLALALQAGGDKPLTSLDLQQLPPGTLVQGKVLSREPLPPQGAQAVYRLLVNLLNTPLAGRQLALDSPLALPLGSLLSAQVQGSQSLNFLPLSGRLDQLVLGQQLAAQHNRQASLEGLLKGLQGLAGKAELSGELRSGIERLLGALPDSTQLSTAKGLAQALEGSGVLLEAKLLQGQTAALPQDLKANLLRLIAQLLPQLPGGAATLAGLQGAMGQALPALARQMLGGLSPAGAARQQALGFPLPSRLLQNLDGEADLETLLKLAAAAVSRLQTHQLSSLAQTQVDANGNLLTTWQLELPMRHQQELIPLQIKLQREDSGKADKPEHKETLWRVELAFDLDHLGPLQVRAQLLRGSLSSQLWAERADTANLIGAELGNLRERLQAAGLEVGELACSQGLPPQGPKTTLEQRWVDETA